MLVCDLNIHLRQTPARARGSFVTRSSWQLPEPTPHHCLIELESILSNGIEQNCFRPNTQVLQSESRVLLLVCALASHAHKRNICLVRERQFVRSSRFVNSAEIVSPICYTCVNSSSADISDGVSYTLVCAFAEFWLAAQ